MKRLLVTVLVFMMLLSLSQTAWAVNDGEAKGQKIIDKFVNVGATSTDKFVQVQKDFQTIDALYYPLIVEVNQATNEMKIQSKIAAELTMYRLDLDATKKKQKPLIEKNVSVGESVTMDLPEENTPYQIIMVDKKNDLQYSVVINNAIDEYGSDFYVGNLNILKLETQLAKEATEKAQREGETIAPSAGPLATPVKLSNGVNYLDSITTNGGSKSYYFIAADSGTANVFLDVSNLPKEVDYDLEVTLPNGAVIGSYLPKGVNELVAIDIVKGQTYNIRVYSYQGSSPDQYVIRYKEYPSSNTLIRPITTASPVTCFFDVSRGAFGSSEKDPGKTYFGDIVKTYCYWNHSGTDFGGDVYGPGYIALAAMDGKVTDWNKTEDTSDSRGLFVEILHPDGRTTRYLHFSRYLMSFIPDVNGEIKVKQGASLGVTGNTGHSFGEHLHFDIAQYGQKECPFQKGWLAPEYP